MELIKKIHRKDYTGENVNLVGLYYEGEWQYQKEFIKNPFVNLKSTTNAVVIGNGVSRLGLNLNLFLPFRQTTAWGERTSWMPAGNSKKFLTYGCNALYREYKPDFLIATGDTIINEIANDSYSSENVVYTNKQMLEKYPGKFSFVPQDPQYNSGAIAAYLAAFDGAKKVFLLGFDGIDSIDNNYNVYAGTNGYNPLNYPTTEDYWVKCLNEIMIIYNDVEFVRVAPSKNFRSPELWKYNLNYRVIDFRNFVIECDL